MGSTPAQCPSSTEKPSYINPLKRLGPGASGAPLATQLQKDPSFGAAGPVWPVVPAQRSKFDALLTDTPVEDFSQGRKRPLDPSPIGSNTASHHIFPKCRLHKSHEEHQCVDAPADATPAVVSELSSQKHNRGSHQRKHRPPGQKRPRHSSPESNKSPVLPQIETVLASALDRVTDAGKSQADVRHPEEDAGNSENDARNSERDARKPKKDVGKPEKDARYSKRAARNSQKDIRSSDKDPGCTEEDVENSEGDAGNSETQSVMPDALIGAGCSTASGASKQGNEDEPDEEGCTHVVAQLRDKSAAEQVSHGNKASAGAAAARAARKTGRYCELPSPPAEEKFPDVAIQYQLDLSPESVKSKNDLIADYRKLYATYHSEGRSKPDLIANKDLRKNRPSVRYLGHPRGVKPGDTFEGRGELEALRIHGKTLNGIDFISSHPAFAVCLSGMYADDDDSGEEIWYTGMGGQKSKRQETPQQLTQGNLALKLSMEMKTPVRVCRAADVEVRDSLSYRMYTYEGLYVVQEMRYVKSREGPKVYQFRLVAVRGHSVASACVKYHHFGARKGIMTCRVLKPTKKSSKRAVKAGQAKQSRKPDREVNGASWRWNNSTSELKRLDGMRSPARGCPGGEAKARILMDDISEGTERVRIPVVNDTDIEIGPPELKYRRDYAFSPAAVIYLSELFARRLIQWDGSQHTTAAPGKQLPDFTTESSATYNKDTGFLERVQFTPCMEDRPSGNSNLVDIATRGIHLPLQVFYTKNKGWGVRCEVDIHVGTFICCYVGRVVTHMEANEAEGRDQYIFDLSHFEQVATHIAEHPDDVEKSELDILPSLPPADFFEWARSSIPKLTANAARPVSVSKLVKNRGLPAGEMQPDRWKTVSGQVGDWEVNAAGQFSAPADKVITACRQEHGHGGCWNSYENANEVKATLSDSCETLAIDAMHEGNVGRFINHSCDPNLEKQTILTYQAGSSVFYYVGFFASEPEGIPAMTELTYDYNWSPESDSLWQCTCGAKGCRLLLR